MLSEITPNQPGSFSNQEKWHHLCDRLLELSQPLYLSQTSTDEIDFIDPFDIAEQAEEQRAVFVPALPIGKLGDPTFQTTHHCRAALYAGSMANGISSPEMVIAMGKHGLLGSYGSGGVLPAEVGAAISQIKSALPEGPYAVNLLNSPFEPGLEDQIVDVLIDHQVQTMEASAYLAITRGLVRYRVQGLKLTPDGKVAIHNHIIAKISRKEIARRFMQPAPEKILAELQQDGMITEQQANLASQVPMADDITVEADSGGHTDNRPLLCLLPTMIAEREAVYQNFPHLRGSIRIGAAGGISTPESALAALMAGAAYVVTGSINQSCIEAATSLKTRSMLAQADMADVIMAPSADMFEMGSRVQVLKRGTMFAMRASKLYELYRAYNAIEEIPTTDREQIEQKFFQRSFDEVWKDTVTFFEARNPSTLERAKQDPKQKMALIFRWYLGLSSRWAVNSVDGREMDYQIWCGPAMGAFNDWVRGSYLEKVENRRVVDVNLHILTGAAYLYRLRILEAQGIQLPQVVKTYHPKSPLV
jgi:trans-AT polyketide synthase, acyltransferase and oxidoreductase domains